MGYREFKRERKRMTITCPNGHKKRIFKRSIVGGKNIQVHRKRLRVTKRVTIWNA